MPVGLIFVNGDLNDGEAVRTALALSDSPLIIAADGGVRHALAVGLQPHVIIGDMDSAPPELLAEAESNGARVLRYPPAKNETDLELALLYAAKHDCNPIRLIAAIGDRLDQTISNIYLLALPDLRGCDVRIVSGKQTMWLASTENSQPTRVEINGQPGDTVSLVPLSGDVLGVSTDGLEYPLRAEALYFGPARGVSNVMLSTHAEVQFEVGTLLIVHTIGRA